MTSKFENFMAQLKDAFRVVFDTFEENPEVFAIAGELFPICKCVAPVLREALGSGKSKEVLYVKDQLLTMRSKLDVLCAQHGDIQLELKKGIADVQYFEVEEKIRHQFRMYMVILEAKPEYQKGEMEDFLGYFDRSGGENNLNHLYSAVMKGSISEIMEGYVAKNHRLLEDFCVQMKELFWLGLIALLGQCALTQGPDEEQEKIKAWGSKIEEVDSKMKTTIESCIAAFPEQAKLDAQRLLQEKEHQSLQDTTDELKEFLKEQYDWVSWSVRLINPSGFSFHKLCVGEHFHHVAGRNWFEVPQVINMTVVVSYSTNPQPVPRDCIRQVMEGQAKKGNAEAVVDVLEKQLCGFVVHAVSQHKKCAAASSFPQDCHYWEKHKNVLVCVHSE